MASLTILCWKATPFKFCPAKLVLSKLTPRVIAIVLPDCNVDAPPVVIFELAASDAPPSANDIAGDENTTDAIAKAAIRKSKITLKNEVKERKKS